MKKLFTLFTACLFALFCVAQNLVPNPSFEEYADCPDNLGQVYKASDWSSVRLTPDYFNTCSLSGNASVPNNFWGYKTPASGNAYAGFAGRYGPGNIREYLGVSLLSPLEIGITYFVSFKVCLSYKENSLTCGINKLGILFSNTIYSENNPAPICNCPQVHTNHIIDNVVNWISIKESFVADSNYSFLNIGNFFTDSLTDSIQIQGSICDAYYYLDDVCVSTDSNYCANWTHTERTIEKNQVKVFPNPANDYLYIDDSSINFDRIQMIDCIGRVILSQPVISNGLMNEIYVKDLSSGLYTVILLNAKQSYRTTLLITH